MTTSNFYWEKINPADIDYIPGVSHFAFSINNEILHVEEANESNLFSQVLISAIKKCLSIYDLDVWVGTSDSEEEVVAQDTLPDVLRLFERESIYKNSIVA